MKNALLLVVVLLGVLPARCVAAPRPLTGVALPNRLTLLTDVGKLERDVPNAEVTRWRRALRAGHLGRSRAARLHLWLGEVEIARNREPERALQEFAAAQRLARRSDPVYGCAAYDRAMTEFFHGAYVRAASEFRDLMRPKRTICGYSFIECALWYRHSAACAGYHARHARLGITEPPSLDPLCGVASLAACMRANHRPYDRKTLVSHCRMTGLGNNMEDLRRCAQRLGMAARVVKADDEGLLALPKPLVAYVEGDHFVALTRADKEGVSYLCSDCGAWPGGRRDLTWKQWHAMDCDLYLAVTRPGSPDDTRLGMLHPQNEAQPLDAGSAASRLAAYRPNQRLSPRALMRPLLSRHVVLYTQTVLGGCGNPAYSGHGTPNLHCDCDSHGDAPGAMQGASGPASPDPVDLATGEEEYEPEPDLTVYNPTGPSVVWRRRYGSLRGLYQIPSGMYPYAGYAFGLGWNTEYDMQVVISSDNTEATLYLPNGGAYQFSLPSTPGPGVPQVACPSETLGAPMLCVWNYNSDGSLSFSFTQPDRSQWVFSSNNGYALTRMIDRNGNFINFVYSTPGQPGYLLTAITDSSNVPLLTIQHGSFFTIASVSDRYGRSVAYKVRNDELVQVSQIVQAGAINPPVHYLYGYMSITNGYLNEQMTVLHTITTPSPTGKGYSTATLNYKFVFIGSVTDGNDNTTTYNPVDDNDTQVVVTDRSGRVVYSYMVSFDNQMRTLSRTDGANKVVYQASYLADNAYQPATETNGNNETTTYTYDLYGQIQTVTSPRNVTTTYTRDYSVFPLGELKQIQEGSKSPTAISYYEPSGLVKTITTPAPGTAGSTETVTTSFTYDALGNVLTVTRPGNDTSATITTTFNYTNDGAYSQADAIGQPLTVTDNLGHITHFRYDARGNRAMIADALGNQTAFHYNLADQQTEMLAPAVGDITGLFRVARSSLTYSGATKTYTGTITLTNTSSRTVQGNLLVALTNLTPGVTLANAHGIYVNSPALLSKSVSLAPGAHTILNVSFAAPSANAVSYDVQTYLTDSMGNPLALPTETRSVYLYTAGPLRLVNLYDETGALMRQVSYSYGQEGELLAVSGSTEPVTYTYDGAYRMQTLSDGNGHATQYVYNQAGWLQSVTYPQGDSVQYPSYDPMGHVLTRIDGRGIRTNYTYNDPESLLTNVHYVNSASYPNASRYNVRIDYDGYGRQQDVFDFSGHTHFDYDDLDTTTEIDTTYSGANGTPLPTVALTYAFNPDGSRHGMNLQTSTTSYDFTYGYDAAGRPISLTNPFSETTQWSYLSNNWLAAQQLANGVSALYAYNQRGFLNDLTHYAANGAPLSDFGAMTYDSAANRLTKAVTIPGAPGSYNGNTTYAYDVKDQLIQEQSTLTGGYNNLFNYDPVGNPLAFKGSSHSFNADNQFTDTGFAYDGEGNPTTYKGTTLTFDPEDHMTSFGAALTAGYRADGLRAWKQTANGTTYFLYDGITPVLELDGTGNITAVNTFGANGLLSRHTSTGSVFYTFDPQGSVSQRHDATGNPITTSAFDAFGSGASTAEPSDPYNYGSQWGYYTDAETGLFLLGHRYYDARAGQFVNRDPIGYMGGVNVYSYVGNHATSFQDPTGHDWGNLLKDLVAGTTANVIHDASSGHLRDTLLWVAAGTLVTAGVVLAAPVIAPVVVGALVEVGAATTLEAIGVVSLSSMEFTATGTISTYALTAEAAVVTTPIATSLGGFLGGFTTDAGIQSLNRQRFDPIEALGAGLISALPGSGWGYSAARGGLGLVWSWATDWRHGDTNNQANCNTQGAR